MESSKVEAAGAATRAGEAAPAGRAAWAREAVEVARAEEAGQKMQREALAAGLETLVQHRGCIDRIDKTIVALLAERVRLGLVLGDIKRDLRLPTRSESREAEVLTHVRQAAAGPLSSQAAERIFSTIIAETTAVQDRSHE